MFGGGIKRLMDGDEIFEERVKSVTIYAIVKEAIGFYGCI
jgi:hypothetical protein